MAIKNYCHWHDEYCRFLYLFLYYNMYSVCFSLALNSHKLDLHEFVAGAFSRPAVNYNAGCKTAVSNIVMATAVMIVLLFLTPLFHYTPLVVLSSIIVSAMLGLIDIHAFYHFWKVDKLDFLVALGAYLGVVFADVQAGLVIAVC